MIIVFNSPATTRIYAYCNTISLHYALPIYNAAGIGRHTDCAQRRRGGSAGGGGKAAAACNQRVSRNRGPPRSEEHTSELQSLMRISYAVFCLKKKSFIASYTNSVRDILTDKWIISTHKT